LAGGNVADRVVRIGATVRKPVVPATPAVEALLEHLRISAFDGAPRTWGRDEQGRQILEYVPGEIALGQPPLSTEHLGRLGLMIRQLHDALTDFAPPADARWNVAIPPDGEDLICHNDLAPWNLVIDGERWVFIDWDGAGPASRLWDLGYAAQSFVPMDPNGDLALAALRLRAFVDGYGLDEQQRRRLPTVIAAHTRGMFDLLYDASTTGSQPWARLYAEGHGDHWGPAADYIERHRQTWTDALLA
jgi:Ser/Thr protein kinase RdoA (MazF antagonist)